MDNNIHTDMDFPMVTEQHKEKLIKFDDIQKRIMKRLQERLSKLYIELLDDLTT